MSKSAVAGGWLGNRYLLDRACNVEVLLDPLHLASCFRFLQRSGHVFANLSGYCSGNKTSNQNHDAIGQIGGQRKPSQKRGIAEKVYVVTARYPAPENSPVSRESDGLRRNVESMMNKKYARTAGATNAR